MSDKKPITVKELKRANELVRSIESNETALKGAKKDRDMSIIVRAKGFMFSDPIYYEIQFSEDNPAVDKLIKILEDELEDEKKEVRLLGVTL